MAEHPETKLFWKLCYNSFWIYHVRDVPLIQGNVAGSVNNLNTCVKKLLRQLHKREISGNEARHRVRYVMEKCDLDTRELLVRILNRDARCGINVKLINSVWPGLVPTHDVMLAQKIDWKKVRYPCICHVKIDGVRALASQEAILTRAGKQLVGLEKLQEQIPKKLTLDGELIIPGLGFQEGCGKIRNYDECPEAVLCTFDIPDSKENFMDRLEQIKQLSIWYPNIREVGWSIAENEQEVRDKFQAAIRLGYEGLVVKPMNYTYERKRSKHWMKVKAMDSYDLRVIGKYEGEGKYVGMLGGIIVDFKGVKVRVGTGFSDYERGKYWEEDIKGNIAEVECHEITRDGSMRHPRFKGFRWDKNEISHE